MQTTSRQVAFITASDQIAYTHCFQVNAYVPTFITNRRTVSADKHNDTHSCLEAADKKGKL